MSKGLGKMQRRILTELEARPGGDAMGVTSELAINWGCGDVFLKKGVHDLRVVSFQMACQYEGISHRYFKKQSWEASFSRAVTRLQKGGLIEVLSLVPVEYVKSCCKCEIHDLADGLYFLWHSKQKRFCRLSQNYLTLKQEDKLS